LIVCIHLGKDEYRESGLVFITFGVKKTSNCDVLITRNIIEIVLQRYEYR